MFQNPLTVSIYWLGLIVALLTPSTPALAAGEVFAPNSPLTITQLVTAVFARNPGLKEQQAAAEAAEYRIAPAGAFDDPALSYSAGPETLGGPRVLNQRLELSQPLPWPGKRALRKQAAQEEARVVAGEEGDLRLQVTAAAKIFFAEWAYVHQALAINREHQALLEELQHVAEIQYAAGLSAQQDALLAEVARARLETEAVIFEHRRHEVQARLNALLDRPPQALVPRPANLPKPVPLPPPEQLQATALRVHPELARIRARLAGAKAQAGLAAKDFYPDFRVMAGYNSFWDEPEKRWTLGFSINLPFDYGSKRSAALDAARADLRQARWQLNDRETQLLSELEVGRAAVEEADAVISVYVRRLVPLAQDSLDAALADYRAGAAPFITVIDAERQQLRTEDELARARADYLRRFAELERWVGAPPVELAGSLSGLLRHTQPAEGAMP